MDASTSQALWSKLTQLRQRILAGGDSGLSALAALELTVPQSMAVMRLVERGPLTITQLQAAVGRSQGATSNLVAQLELRRLAIRKPDSEDRRRTLVHPTPKAAQLVEKVEGFRQQAFDKALKSVPAATLRQLDAALTAVLAAMEEQP